MKRKFKFHTTFIHEDRMLWFQLIDDMNKAFRKYDPQLKGVRKKAQEVRKRIEKVDGMMQHITSRQCPVCSEVCCINLHSYPDHMDLLYLIALNEKVPSFQKYPKKSACHFLDDSGCTIERALRPFRCTWYFCTSLLDYMEINAGSAIRKFNHDMIRLIEIRKEMLEEFSDVMEDE